MRNKLRLAIACIIVEFIQSFIVRRYPEFFLAGDGFAGGFRTVLSILSPLCTLGLLPFFVGLYKSKSFMAIMEQEEATTPGNVKDQTWVKHLLIRVGIFVAVGVVLFGISSLDKGMGSAFLVIYGIAYTLGIGSIVLIIEAIVLFVRKCPYKASSNIVLIAIALSFLMWMM